MTVGAHELVGLLRHGPDGEGLHPLVRSQVEERVLLLLDLCDVPPLREDLLEAGLPDRGGLDELLVLVATVLELFVLVLFFCLWLFEDLAHDSFPCTRERCGNAVPRPPQKRGGVLRSRDYPPSGNLCNHQFCLDGLPVPCGRLRVSG